MSVDILAELDESLVDKEIALHWEEVETLKKFRTRIEASGFFQFYLSFGDGNIRINDLITATKFVPTTLQRYVKLLLCGEIISENECIDLIGLEACELFQNAGMLSLVKQGISFGEFRLISYHGYPYFFELSTNPRAYFGEDSVALAVYQMPPRGGTSLDLCNGPGIQMMVSAQTAQCSFGVEIDSLASKVCSINVALSGLHEKCTIFNQSFESFFELNEKKFDLITFNPPLLPVPDDLKYPFVGHGGADGLEISKKIIRLGANHLNENGAFSFIGTSLGTADSAKFFTDQLNNIADELRLSCQISVLSSQRLEDGNDFYESLLCTTSQFCGKHISEIRSSFKEHALKLAVDELYVFCCYMRRSTLSESWVANFSTHFNGGWFV